jgi:site-specific recombinase XerD
METTKAVAAFLTSRVAKNVTLKTRSNWRWALNHLGHLQELPTEPFEVELVLAEATGRLGTESMFTLYRRLKDFFEWTGTRYQVPNPFLRANPYGSKPQLLIQPPVRPELLPKILSPDQLRLLLHPGSRSPRDRLMVLLPLDTGLRLAEIATIDKANVSPDLLRVQGKGRQFRDVPLSREILHDLLYIGNSHNPWISKRTGAPLTKDGVQLAYRRIFARSGVEGSVHHLRHTFATMYLRRGGNLESLRRILGHRSIKTTEIYLHLVTSDLVDSHRDTSPVHQFYTTQGRLL